MKTIIDIPEPLYRSAEERAVERGWSVPQLVLDSLSRALGNSAVLRPPVPESLAVRRRILPEFERLEREGAFDHGPRDRDMTQLISDDRDGR